jgi:hypothetical protein
VVVGRSGEKYCATRDSYAEIEEQKSKIFYMADKIQAEKSPSVRPWRAGDVNDTIDRTLVLACHHSFDL